MPNLDRSVQQLCVDARRASLELAALDSATKNAALLAVADALVEREGEIIAANKLDLAAGKEAGLSAALIDRLTLTGERIAAISAAVRDVVALPDPVGEVIDGQRLANGLQLERVRSPLGVIAVVYEARPNVTVDAAALCVKSGNAVVLRGSSSAANSNRVLGGILAEVATANGLPEGAIGTLSGGDRQELAELATQNGLIDLIIPRGGEGLKRALEAVATVPVIYAAAGNCHVYVDAQADLERAEAIVINAKTQRPGVCNAVETLLVHRDVAAEFIPRVAAALTAAGVELRGCPLTRQFAGDSVVLPASESDWQSEYLALILAVRVVDSLEDALQHIATYGSGHSEAVVTESYRVAESFQRRVDAACVYINASTRFTDGGEFGMGAEIGISTQKLHARGPIGLRELCSYRYVVRGNGQIRP